MLPHMPCIRAKKVSYPRSNFPNCYIHTDGATRAAGAGAWADEATEGSLGMRLSDGAKSACDPSAVEASLSPAKGWVKAFAAEWVSRGSDHADAAQCRFYYLVKQLNRSRQMPPRPRKSQRDASYASLRELCDAAKPVLVQAGMPSLSSRINVSSLVAQGKLHCARGRSSAVHHSVRRKPTRSASLAVAQEIGCKKRPIASLQRHGR